MPEHSPVIDRKWILVSHANPEDNRAATWFATQLASEGYRVWSDVICLIGGEDFWRDIEDVIRFRAAKVVYLLSRASNVKEGCDRELHTAQIVARKEKLHDFIIPLRIDDIEYSDANIRIGNLNIIEARAWNIGLTALLKKLDEEGVPKRAVPDRSEISAGWKDRFSTRRSVTQEPETMWSNWFRVESDEHKLYRHCLRRTEIGLIGSPGEMPWPTVEDQIGIWSFANADATAAKLPKPYYIERTEGATITRNVPSPDNVQQIAFRLISIGIESELRNRGLIPHELSGGKRCFAFPKGLIENDEATFISASGKKARRAMVGYKTRIDSKGSPWARYWHFAIQLLPVFKPDFVVLARSHVLFSTDGTTIWDSKEKLQKARKNQCKNWWNDAWRDRLHAAMSWLANGAETIALDVGAQEPMRICASSVRFESPVSYIIGADANVSDLMEDRPDQPESSHDMEDDEEWNDMDSEELEP